MIYGFQKKYEKALAQVQKGITLNPGFPIMHLGYVLVWVGRYEEAVNYFQKAIRHDPKAPTFYYNGLGHAYRGLEQYEDAITAYNKALERDPDYLIGRIFLISAYYLGGREAEARAEVAEVRRLDPNYSVARLIKVLPYQDKKFYNRTIESIRKAGLQEHPPLPLPDKPSIAVLPFVNMSDDPKQEYFSDGISEDLITDLSKFSGLLVIARNSTFTYKNKSVKVQQIAKELGVAYVLEGSVRKVADKVRINAQLIDGITGHHVWAERFDDTYIDIFALQDKITRKIVAALSLKLSEDEEDKLTLRYTDNVEAYDAYLRGREQIRLGSAKGLAKAVALFERAIELDPDYSAAHAGLANVYRTAFDRHFYKDLGWQDARSRAKKHLQMAMKNPTPCALYNVAKARLYQRRFDEAIAEAERAITLDPNYSNGYLVMGWILTYTGQTAEAVKYLKKTMRLDPQNVAYCLYLLGLAQYLQKDCEGAVVTLEKSQKLAPNYGPWPLAISYAQLNRGQEAADILAKYFEKRGWEIVPIENTFRFWPFREKRDLNHWAEGLRRSGLMRPWNPVYRRDYAKAISDAKKAIALKPDDAHALYTMGETLVYSGKSDEAIDYLTKAMSLGTEYPKYYMYTLGVAQFCLEKYEEAATSLEEAILKRKYHNRAPRWMLAATYAQLGRQEDAEDVLIKYMQDRKYKNYTVERVLKYYMHSFKDPNDTERFARGLHKAGLPTK